MMEGQKPRGSVRRKGNGLELRAYAGTDPATGRADYLREPLPSSTPEREVNRRLTALVARADDLAATRRRRRRDGGHVPRVERNPRRRTVSDALEGWWQDHGQDLSGADTARTVIDAYLTPHLGGVALWRLRGKLDKDEADLDPDLVDLSAFYRQLRAVGGPGRPSGRRLEPSAVLRIHGVLRGALAAAVRKGWLPENPASAARLPRLEERESTTPDMEEMREFLAFLREPRVVAGYKATRRTLGGGLVTYEVPAREVEPDTQLVAFALLVASGPRPQEVAAIRWGAFDLDAGRLSLTGEGVVRVKDDGQPEQWVVRRGETEKRRLMISLDAYVLDVLREHRRRRLEAALSCGVSLGRKAFVFSNTPDGAENVAPHAITVAFERQVRRARAAVPEGMRLYDARHFGITQLLGRGVSVVEVARRFGTSPRMIHARYAHAIPGDDARAAEAMTAVWGPPRARAAGAAEPAPIRLGAQIGNENPWPTHGQPDPAARISPGKNRG